jgi:hypothetical protein
MLGSLVDPIFGVLFVVAYFPTRGRATLSRHPSSAVAVS